MKTMRSTRSDAEHKGVGLVVILSICIAVALSACGPEPLGPDDDVAGQQYEVVGGAIEPDYKYPWVVHFTGGLTCRGVLIEPTWVLTAAHCVNGVVGKQVSWSRTDPYSGVTYSQARTASHTYKHPDYQLTPTIRNDVALIQLSSPFVIDKYIQTVGLPTTPKTIGLIGTVASVRNDPGQTLGTGQVAVYRAPLTEDLEGLSLFEISLADSNDVELHEGDSGSGLVTVEGGRALVRGIASYVTMLHGAGFSDVYGYRSWILTTMNKTDTTLAGNTRVRWSGHTSRGIMGLGCTNPAGTMWGPLNVVGVQVGANCPGGGSQSVICSLESNQPYIITSFKMKTIYANGSTTTQTLSHTSRWASDYSITPAGVTREFTCSVGWNLPTKVALPGTVVAK